MLKVKCCFYRTKHRWRWIIDAEPQQELCNVHANQRVRTIRAQPLPCVDLMWGRRQQTNARGTSLFRLAQQIPCTERPKPQRFAFAHSSGGWMSKIKALVDWFLWELSSWLTDGTPHPPTVSRVVFPWCEEKARKRQRTSGVSSCKDSGPIRPGVHW